MHFSIRMFQEFDWLNSLKFLKTDVKLISQELKHILQQAVKFTGKFI